MAALLPRQLHAGRARSGSGLTEALALAAALLIFFGSTLPHLADFPTPTDDEVWVLSASYKLVREGVFGSDMFAGFFDADRRYYFNMPGHHLVLAALFRLIGAGIAEGRLAGIGYGVATLLLSYLLARRLYGVPAALLCLLLLLCLRLNMGFDTGLPLQELAVNLRYDLAPVPFLLGGVLLLLGKEPGTEKREARVGGWTRDGRLLPAAAAGALFGVATLMQFYGAFLFPVAALFLWLERLPAATRLRLIGALIAAGALVGLPYGAYVLQDREAFAGQAGTIDRRADFADPRFYVKNLLQEPERFVRPLAIPFAFTEVPAGKDPFVVPARSVGIEALVRRPSAKLGVLAGLPLAIGFCAWRWRRTDSRSDRLLCLCLGGLVLQYAFLEATKFYFYWLPVVPFLCVGLGGACAWLLRLSPLAPLPREPRLARLAAGLTALLLLAVVAEGSVARLNGIRAAPQAASYATLTAAVHAQVPAGARVVGATSLWWGLRDTEYRSYFLFFYLTRDDAGTYRRSIPAFLDEFGSEYIVLTRLAQAELEKHLSPADFAAWQGYLHERATPLSRIEGPIARGYGYVDMWRINR